MKLFNLLFETIYDKYNEEMLYNNKRATALFDQAQNRYIKKLIPLLDLYLQDNEKKKNILDFLKLSADMAFKRSFDYGNHNEYRKQKAEFQEKMKLNRQLWIEFQEKIKLIGKENELNQIQNEWSNADSSIHALKTKWDNEIVKKYNKISKDYLEFSGNINSKYLYHFTTVEYAYRILYDNMLIGGDENGDAAISFTTNKNLINRGVVFWYPSEYTEGRTSKNLSVCFVFDFNKIKNEYKGKIKKGNEYIGTHVGESEIRLKLYEFDNVDKYLLSVIIDKDKIGNHVEEYNKLIKECKSKNIKYYLKNEK
jgi:hypothetical protein